MTRLQRRLQAHASASANPNADAGPLLGVAAYFYDPAFFEIAARLGYHAAWIEMEHAPISFGEAADLCRIAQGVGLLTMIRVPDGRRESILRAAECGPDILDVPMANTLDVIDDLVKQARFAPRGERGFFSSSRAVHYGLVDNIAKAQQQINDDLCLMVQIETRAAAERADELCAIDGVDIFIGPADLSASFGVPGEPGHPLVRQASTHIIDTARRHGKHLATAVAPAEFDFWIGRGIDLLFCTNDIAALRTGATQVLQQARASIDRMRTTPGAS